MTLVTPGGFIDAAGKMNEPAQKLEIPSDDVLTYANMDLTRTMEIFEEYGVRLLTPEEVAEQMPQFPLVKS